MTASVRLQSSCSPRLRFLASGRSQTTSVALQNRYQRYVGWDKADANANFPGYYDEIVVLDGLDVAETYQTERVEEILELFDWTGLKVCCQPFSLDRLKGLLRRH